MSAAESLDVILEGWRSGLAPDPVLTVSEWADLHRFLDTTTSSKTGQWRTSKTPYLREIQDSLGPLEECERVVFMKGSQIGATEAGQNWVGFSIDIAPGPILFVRPSRVEAQNYSKQRIAPMIRLSPRLGELVSAETSRASGNTILIKEFRSGYLAMVGANSPASLASMPARYLFADEIDRWPGSLRGEGDPLSIARRALATFVGVRKEFLCSTPTVKGFSRIEREFKRSDQRYYFLPCPKCRHDAPIFWQEARAPKALRDSRPFVVSWPKDKPAEARLRCGKCGRLLGDEFRTQMLAGGGWNATAKSDVRGFHLSALYAPVGLGYSIGQLAEQFIAATKEGRDELQPFVNTKLGETWEEPGDAIETEPLLRRLEVYDAEVPMGAMLLTAGVDVQDDRLEIEVVGWGRKDESWSIDCQIFHGEPDAPEVWRELDDYLDRTFEHESGAKLRIGTTFIDSGAFTQNVYEFCFPRRIRGVYACKGQGSSDRSRRKNDIPIATPSKKTFGKHKRPLRLWIIGTDEAKRVFYGRLRRQTPGPGYCHFPRLEIYDEEFFKQLTAEKRVPVEGGYVWAPIRKRNEKLDCRVYATGAREIRTPQWDVLERRLKAAAARDDERQDEEKKPTTKKRRRSTSWVNRGRGRR